MMTIFIADLHLQTDESVVTSGFLRFLQREAISADALYILGDLFETWIGDNNPIPLYRRISAAINKLVSSGVPCYFIHGNRDFLLGKCFAHESGITLLSEEQVINLYGHKILIMHGDALCTDDTNYQVFRTKVETKWIQKFFLILPLSIRNYIATRIRTSSKISNNIKSSSIMDVNQLAVVKIMKKYSVQWLIHGHTHRPDIYNLSINNIPVYRIALGAWCKEGSMVKVTPDGVKLITFSF